MASKRSSEPEALQLARDMLPAASWELERERAEMLARELLRLDTALTRAELQLQELGSPTPTPPEATAPFEDPGADAREPDPPGLREAQRQIMEEHGYEMPDWTPRAERSPSAERTEVERLRLALTRAMDRGNELEIACDHHRMFWQHYERALKVIAEGRSPVPADRIAQGALSSLDSEHDG